MYINFTPYSYSICNPINFYDIDGRLLGGDPWRPVKQVPYSEPGGGLDFIGYAQGATIGVVLATNSKKIWEDITPTLKNLFKPTEEILVLADPINAIVYIIKNVLTRNKEVGIESQIENVEEHLGKIEGMSSDNPDPGNLRNKWKKDIKTFIREAYKDFKQLSRKIKNKNFKEYLERTLGKDRFQDLTKRLKEQGIDLIKTALEK